MEVIYIILNLLLIAIVSTVCFYLLVYPGLTIREAFKLVTVASALNKLFFTGSGYFASSYFSRDKNMPFYKTLSAFLILEAMGALLWLGLGIYFGAEFAVKIPVIFVPAFIILLLMAWFQRKKLVKAVKSILSAFKDMGRKIPIVSPFIILNMALSFIYYFFLFGLFNFHPGILPIIKIIPVAFAVGYLSPAPAGLGFRDTGLVLLLMGLGAELNTAVLIAVFDRVFVTGFWGILGSVFGYDLLKKEIKRRIKIRGYK